MEFARIINDNMLTNCIGEWNSIAPLGNDIVTVINASSVSKGLLDRTRMIVTCMRKVCDDPPVHKIEIDQINKRLTNINVSS